MSLFKTEEFWSGKCGVGEKFTASTLCVANFLSDSNKSDQIICGSLNGLLRMYSQVGKLSNTTMSSDGDTNPFSMINIQNEIDICMEYNIRLPVLQMSTGKFIIDRTISIAVLTPQKLILMIIDEISMSFKVMEEFSFQRMAFNFCYGNFGHVSDRDFVCVQSTDGTLSFYVNGHLSFVSYLASALLPSPINYLAQDDSILVVSGARFLEGYKYKNLAISNSTGLSTSQKRATADWSINIGENALEICLCNSIKDGTLVIVLSRYSIFIINNNSGVVLKKRFETRLRSLMSYGESKDNCPRLLVTNCLGELMVFSGTSLRWKARIAVTSENDEVVALTLGKFNELSNFIVTLTALGRLSIEFLGTDPSLTSIGVAGSRDVMAVNNENELSRLQHQIKTITTNQNSSTAMRVRTKENRSSLKVVVDLSSARLITTGDIESSLEYVINLRLKSSTAISNVIVRVSLRAPLVARENIFHYATLASDKEVLVPVSVRSNAAMVVCSLRVMVYVTYDTAEGRVAVSQASFSVPLSLVTEVVAPCKQATFKVTLDSSESTVPLRKLFPELSGTPGLSGEEERQRDVALGLQYHGGGPLVTILASATSTRYRLQSDTFEALWLVLTELSQRLTTHFGASFHLQYTEPVPLEAFFLVLDFHWSVRVNLRQYGQLLEQRAKQCRSVEKLMLSRTKDKSETSLRGLDSLLDNCLGQLMHLADLLEEQQQHLVIVGNALSSATSLIGCLTQLSVDKDDTEHSRQKHWLEAALSGAWRDYPPDLGLEEIYGVTMAHLLKHVIVGGIKSGHGESLALAVTTLECPDNLDKIKRHLVVLCDRVAKGVKVSLNEDRLGLTAEIGDNEDLSKGFVVSPRVHGKGKKSKKKAAKVDLLE